MIWKELLRRLIEQLNIIFLECLMYLCMKIGLLR